MNIRFIKKPRMFTSVTSTLSGNTVVSSIDGGRIYIQNWRSLKKAMVRAGQKKITLLAEEIKGRDGRKSYRFHITKLRPADTGRVIFWNSFESSKGRMLRVALFQDAANGEFRLVWYNHDSSLKSSWTPFPPPPPKEKKKVVKKMAFVSRNRYAPLLEPEILKPEKKKKVLLKLGHFPPLGRRTSGNPTASAYNSAWGGDVHKLIEKVEATKSATKQAALAKKETEKKVSRCPRLKVGLRKDNNAVVVKFDDDSVNSRDVYWFYNDNEGCEDDSGDEDFDLDDQECDENFDLDDQECDENFDLDDQEYY